MRRRAASLERSGHAGDSEEGILVLEDNAGQLPAASVHSKAQRAWDVKEIFKMEALFFCTQPYYAD